MLLEVQGLSKVFRSGQREVHALNGVSLSLEAGSCLGIIGESGSGKSTLANVVAGLLRPDAGRVLLDGQELNYSSRRSVLAHQRKIQMIFQEPRSSFDPRMSIGASLRQPLSYVRQVPRAEHNDRVARALTSVGLSADLAQRRVHEVSVGQAQRAAIARALLAEPTLLICDEMTSALDVTVQADILELLARLREEQELSMVFVSHDIAVVAGLADRVAVMHNGDVVEQGSCREVIGAPQHPYTTMLVELA